MSSVSPTAVDADPERSSRATDTYSLKVSLHGTMDRMLTSNFSNIDWIIVVGYLLGTAAIGLYANRFIHNVEDYMVAGRSLRSFISIATMLGSEIGLVTVMYTAQKGYTGGMAAFHIGLAGGITCLFVGLTGFLVVPLRETGVMTIPEYYGRRFGKSARVLGGVILASAGILNMGVFLKVGAIFVSSLIGIEDVTTVNSIMCVLIGLVLLYTILGGMISVVITDYVQFVVLAFGMILTSILAWRHLGWQSIVATVERIHGEQGFDPFDQGGFGVTYVVWMFFTFGLISCAVWPTAVMRVCSAADSNVVRRLYTWSSVGFMTRVIIPQFLGICALTYLWTTMGADSRFFDADGQIITEGDASLQALPVFLSQILPVGIIGLVCAGMLAAFMSTHDSYMLCWAAVYVEDVINPLTDNTLKPKTQLLLTRIIVFFMGLFLLFWSLWYPLSQDVLDYLAVSGAIYFCGAFAVLLFGLYWPRASAFGAHAAMLTASLAVLGLTPVQEFVRLPECIVTLVDVTGMDSASVLKPAGNAVGYIVREDVIGLCTAVTCIAAMVIGSMLVPDRNSIPKQESP